MTVKQAGATWRILSKNGDREFAAANEGIFDELVIDDWLHLEQMDASSWWMRVGDARINIELQRDGQARIGIERGVYAR